MCPFYTQYVMHKSLSHIFRFIECCSNYSWNFLWKVSEVMETVPFDVQDTFEDSWIYKKPKIILKYIEVLINFALFLKCINLLYAFLLFFLLLQINIYFPFATYKLPERILNIDIVSMQTIHKFHIQMKQRAYLLDYYCWKRRSVRL